MTVALWLPPLVRVLATGLLVASASAIAEALGPFWGALIASLPVSTGPAYVFLAMQHSADFVAASALSSFAANAATGLFLIAYGALGGRLSPWPALGTAVLVWLAASLAVHQVTWTPSTAFFSNLGVYGAGIALLATGRGAELKSAPPTQRARFDLLVRALAVGTFVSLVVTVSSILGPDITGIATVFPISLVGLIIIVRPRIGGPASALIAANALRAMLGFGMMLLCLHLLIRPWGAATALVTALLVSASWSAALLLLRRRQRLA